MDGYTAAFRLPTVLDGRVTRLTPTYFLFVLPAGVASAWGAVEPQTVPARARYRW